jgi:hypothetical protein
LAHLSVTYNTKVQSTNVVQMTQGVRQRMSAEPTTGKHTSVCGPIVNVRVGQAAFLAMVQLNQGIQCAWSACRPRSVIYAIPRLTCIP